MRTQDQNPAYRQYGHLLPANGRYPAKWVDIFWNKDGEDRVRDLEVVFVPRGHPALERRRGEIVDGYSQYNERWQSDLGNSCADWLEPGGLSPASIFGVLLFHTFASRGEFLRALEEFGHIEECEWAREMLRSYKQHAGIEDDEEEA